MTLRSSDAGWWYNVTMARPRFQFRLSTLLWITLAVACWFGGMRYEQWLAESKSQATSFNPNVERPW